ncbi:MAG: hypothetical protein K0S68_648 [Candidatus Saccharibacteria bacterium]|nr:hypothetical protein [Candidatus Saccharibacteria bacterium]
MAASAPTLPSTERGAADYVQLMLTGRLKPLPENLSSAVRVELVFSQIRELQALAAHLEFVSLVDLLPDDVPVELDGVGYRTPVLLLCSESLKVGDRTVEHRYMMSADGQLIHLWWNSALTRNRSRVQVIDRAAFSIQMEIDALGVPVVAGVSSKSAGLFESIKTNDQDIELQATRSLQRSTLISQLVGVE